MSAADRTALHAALRECEHITRRRARNFYYGLKLTPQPQRAAMYAVYAWMRHADDLADEAGLVPDERRRRIDALRERTERLFAGELPERGPDDGIHGADCVWLAMADTVARFRLSPEPFRAMLDGQMEDVERREYQTFEQLRGFCYRVASTVGLVCIAIWGYDDPRAKDLAIDRGIAFQLTNILRDFREDFGRGRVYLPAEDLQRHGLDAERLLGWDDPAACGAFVLEQAARVEQHYRRSSDLDSIITPSCRPTLWAMTTIYHGLLAKIQQAPERIVAPRRIRLSSLTKALIALRARRYAAAVANEIGAAPAPATRPSSR